MVTISNQGQARALQGMEFCFLCGDPFRQESEGLRKTLDHLPPRAIFAISDRNFPLKVPAHYKCNHDWSKQDDVVGELVAVVHGKTKELEDSRLEFTIAKDELTGAPLPAVGGLNLEQHVIRWVRGFHAALYGEFLAYQESTIFCVSLPTPRLSTGARAAERMRNLLRNHIDFVEVIKNNRMAEKVDGVQRLDSIRCNNGKFTYECVWIEDDGQERCVFAIQIYNWQQLRPDGWPKTSCVGMYAPKKGRPSGASKGLSIELPILNLEPFDAFSN